MSLKGDYYKIKTKKWFLSQGYQCEYLEKLQRIYSKGKIFYIKKDLFYSDGLAINDKEIIFWNSKLNRNHIAEGRNKYSLLNTPKSPCIKKWLVIWKPRCANPDIIEC